MRIPELLLPAGDFNKLKTAIEYGGDAFYIGGSDFSLRTASKNFSFSEIKKAIKLVHSKGKKLYLALNIFPHENDFPKLKKYLLKIADIGLDALIISDLGILSLVQELKINIPIHISTQANILNHYAIDFLKKSGVKRVILGRELSFLELKRLRKKCKDIELEIFVHGAMCMSYSGRCLLSLYLNNRDANKGDCSQPCRWEYSVIEKKRPGIEFPVIQEDKGSYIFNSKDLCLIEYLDKIAGIGIDSIKIEGRVKGEYYVSVIARVYKEALEYLNKHKKDYKVSNDWLYELENISHRPYTDGFFNGYNEDIMRYDSSSYIRNTQVLGKITGNSKKGTIIKVKNNISLGDNIEIFTPNETCSEKVSKILIDNIESERCTNQKTAIIPFSKKYPKGSFIRRKI